MLGCGSGFWSLKASRASFYSWNGRIIPKNAGEVKAKWTGETVGKPEYGRSGSNKVHPLNWAVFELGGFGRYGVRSCFIEKRRQPMKNRRIYLAAAAAAVLVTLGFPTFRVCSYGSHRRNASSSRKVDDTVSDN
jgi:hypothetical protein